MNWEAISTIVEIGGFLLILASLTYVARQLKQTSSQIRINASGERLVRDFDIVLPVIESREFAEVWLQGDNEFHNLCEADKQRLLFFERRAIMLWYHLRMQNLLPDANWHEQIWIIKNIGRRQAIREAWQVFRGGFDAQFQEFVDGQFLVVDEELS